MSNFSELVTKNRLIFIILLALILRLIPFFIYQPWRNSIEKENVLVSDAKEYHKLGLHILNKGNYPVNTYVSAKRTPIYPLFLAFIYCIFGIRPYVVLLLQILMNLVTLFLIYKISVLFLNRKVAIIAVLLYAFDPISIFYTQALLSESIVTTFFLLSFWNISLSLKTKKIFYTILGGIFLGFSSLTKPVFQFFPIVVLFFIISFFHYDLKKASKYIFLFAIGFIIILFPWLYHNYQFYNKASLSTILGENLLFHNAARLKVKVEGISFVEAQQNFRLEANKNGVKQLSNPFDKEKLFRKMGFSYIREHFLPYILVNIEGIANFYFTPGSTILSKIIGHHYIRVDDYTSLRPRQSYSQWIKDFIGIRTNLELAISILVIFYYLFLYFSAIASIPFFCRQKNYFAYVIFSCASIFYITILTGPVGHARFRLPIIPFIIMFSSVGIYNFVAKRNLE